MELVARVKAGDDGAYAELIRRHHPRIIALCRSLLPEAAEDAAQEAFLKAYSALGDFRGDCAFSSWLYRIAANKCLDWRRRMGRSGARSLDAALEDPGAALRLPAAPGPEPALADRQLLEAALGGLPRAYRLILTLRELNGLSYEEIAETMDCSLDSVKARLQRARRDLLERLRHLVAPEDV
ncbi:MAG: sigma-70 family RNA polymerase sigma factor [Elusimicrobia bacterium]|nr:sigma-70 family RNA polymerase sigma factor [Elusimicrobiota bacterium]MDE2425964.1 sigma-70 family RNA polymerase sigma factor [Elusimicrobiota bacterium]